MRLLCHVAASLDPPQLTYMSKERKRLAALFRSSDLNGDGKLDLNEWMLLLLLQQKLMPVLKSASQAPHANKLLRAMRREKKALVERGAGPEEAMQV